jgi:hypothetical protein
MSSMGDVLVLFAVVSAMMVQSMVSGALENSVGVCIDRLYTSSTSESAYNLAYSAYRPDGSPKEDPNPASYCDRCYPPIYPINTDKNWNTTITGYYCDDLSEGSSTSEAADDWQFWGQANGRGGMEWVCRTGGSQGRACSCSVTCLWSSCDASSNNNFNGACRCAMHGDKTQHYCFNTIKACPICPTAGTASG